jgi:hypothetical protein
LRCFPCGGVEQPALHSPGGTAIRVRTSPNKPARARRFGWAHRRNRAHIVVSGGQTNRDSSVSRSHPTAPDVRRLHRHER